jgi:hypothetical protein
MAWRSEYLQAGGEPAAAATAGEPSVGSGPRGRTRDLGAASFQLAWTYTAQGRYRAAAQLLAESSTALESCRWSSNQPRGCPAPPNMLAWQALCRATLGELRRWWQGHRGRRRRRDPDIWRLPGR